MSALEHARKLHIVERKPRPSEPFAFATALEIAGRWREAAVAYELILQADPHNDTAWLHLGICLVRDGDCERALRALECCLELNPDSLPALTGKAIALHLSGNQAEARRLYRRIEHQRPDLSRDLQRISGATIRGRSGVELQPFGALSSPPPGESFAELVRRGVAAMDTDDRTTARAAFTMAQRTHPSSGLVHFNLGVLAELASDWVAAKRHYARCLRDSPHHEKALWNIALILESENDRAGAARLYEQIAARDPRSADAWFRLGFARLACGLYQESASAFEECLKLKNPWVEAAYNAGLAYLHLDNFRSARELFQSILDVQPTSADALRGLAVLAMKQSCWDEAIARHSELIANGGRTAENLYNRAWLAHRTGKFAEAVEMYQEALALKPDFPQAALNLKHAQAQLKPKKLEAT